MAYTSKLYVTGENSEGRAVTNKTETNKQKFHKCLVFLCWYNITFKVPFFQFGTISLNILQSIYPSRVSSI